MATMKTRADLDNLCVTIGEIEFKHYQKLHKENQEWCYAALCMKCGEIIYSCQPEWAERQCQCDNDD